MKKEIDVDINECGENKYPCKIVIEDNSVHVLCKENKYNVVSIEKSKYVNDLNNGIDVEKNLEEQARAWIKTYLNKEISRIGGQ
ncbi:MAG: hypothetical protein IJ530_08815 [Treponema sp.]|jgi:hypothetical protein|uniref:hypothetical protein n=1 Tax=Treponema sp. TaxID=166 RepID=UPI0025F53485|nr:hypothetical protein [Treponema sp.]MBQ8679854.1 hypothetical protein [Treponema sp.]